MGATNQPQWKEDSPSDAESFAFSFSLSLDFLKQDRLWSKAIDGGWRRLLNNVSTARDRLGFIECCATFRKCLVTSGSFAKASIMAPNIRYMRGLISCIEHTIEGNLCVHPSRDFDVLATFLGWLKRLPVDIRSDEESFDEYYKSDRRIASVDFDACVYVPMLRGIWKEWFGAFTLKTPFRPYHSSGSTADAGRIRATKWRKLGVDPVARVCFRDAQLNPLLSELPIRPFGPSKVVIVPKQAGKGRTICMEPSSLQWLQHGVADQLVAFASRPTHPLSRLVTISDQETNRQLCSVAYADELATIDLSNASDSVAWELVKRLTFGLPLGRYLKGSRSILTNVGGYISEFAKFAPMGSALCFPIESYIFASIVELALRLCCDKVGAGPRYGCSVYGDDIIVPRYLYQKVVEILTSLGFEVNREKSFDSGLYFESCGVEYNGNVLINTVRHPRTHLLCKGMVSPVRIGMVTDLANSLLQQGYLLARRRLLKYYLELFVHVDGSRAVPFSALVAWGPDGINSVREPRVDTEWSEDLHRAVKRQKAVRPTCSPQLEDWFEAKSRLRERDRSRRLHDLHPPIRRIECRSCLSDKAVFCLAKFGWFELLEQDDVDEVGPIRTGRLRYRLRTQFV